MFCEQLNSGIDLLADKESAVKSFIRKGYIDVKLSLKVANRI